MLRRSGLMVLPLAVLLAGCGDKDSRGTGGPAPRPAVMLNDVSVAAVLGAITNAKLPAVNAHDATATRCPEAGCLQATDTDTVSILKFPSTGRAELYAAAIPNMLQVEDIVLVFAPTVTDTQKTAYVQAVNKAMR